MSNLWEIVLLLPYVNIIGNNFLGWEKETGLLDKMERTVYLHISNKNTVNNPRPFVFIEYYLTVFVCWKQGSQNDDQWSQGCGRKMLRGALMDTRIH